MKRFIFTILLSLLTSAYAQSITIYTKCGTPVTGLCFNEMTDIEIAEINADRTSRYPNATLLGNASTRYNCHSYAWNMTDGGITCWINSTDNNLDKYLKNDYYAPTTSASAAIKVFYQNSDHSAVVSTVVPGMYESKWGRGPLMRHAPEYGPYGGSRVLYRRCNATCVMSCSNGDGPTSVGVVSTYGPRPTDTLTPYGPNVYYSWSIFDHKGEDAIGIKANIQTSGVRADISFNKTGVYEIYCHASLEGVTLATLWFEAIVE